jgi:DNA (cytosine-5)-methyltransferase 1
MRKIKAKAKTVRRPVPPAPRPCGLAPAELRETAPGRNGDPQPGLRMASLFTGIGGFDLGFEAAGFTTTFQCEIHKFCVAILRNHWKTVPRWENIKNLSHATIPLSHVWTAGFPCQDVSLARMGPRAGLKGHRSGLFHEFARLIGEGRPELFYSKTFTASLIPTEEETSKSSPAHWPTSGMLLDGVCLTARTSESPSHASESTLSGVIETGEAPGKYFLRPNAAKGMLQARRSNGAKPLSPFKRVLGDVGGQGPVYQAIAYCLYACSARHTGTDWSRTYVSYPKRGEVRRLTCQAECEGIMGFPKRLDCSPPREANYSP